MALAIESGKDGDGTIEISFTYVNEWELIISERSRKAIRFVEPTLSFIRVRNSLLNVTACIEEAGGAEQTSYWKVLWFDTIRWCSEEFSRVSRSQYTRQST